ncbi:MAG TPA: ribbon-helix-helix domain-containing protein [Burkholderiales bacterium]|nr:ribbon-helix-helix domain-containing protein [Burkholderiales bacterium]
MKTAVLKRSIKINGKKTSISLEDEFWYGLLEIAAYQKIAVPALVEKINNRRAIINLSSTIRIFVFNYFRRPVGKRGRDPVKQGGRSRKR